MGIQKACLLSGEVFCDFRSTGGGEKMKLKLTKKHFNSIRTKTMMMLTGVFLTIVAIIYLTLSSIMLNKINLLEQQYMWEHMERVENAVDYSLQGLAADAFDWAVWDDTYSYVRDHNKAYEESNLTPATFANLKIDIMAYVDEDGQWIFAGALDPETKQIRPVAEAFKTYVKNSPILKNTDPGYRFHNLIMLPDKPMLLAACPILASDGTGPVRGHVLVAAAFDQTRVGQLSKQLDVELEAVKLDQAEGALEARLAKERNPFVKILNDNEMEGMAILRDAYGQPAIGLKIKKNRDVHQVARSGLLTTLMVLTGAFFLLLLVQLAFLDRKILRRLQSLSEGIRMIGQKRNFSARLSVNNSKDEITVVASSVNELLGEIENSQIQVRGSETALKKAVAKLQVEIVAREKNQEKIKYIANHDSLTGLPNRRLLTSLLRRSINKAALTDRLVAVLFLDIDGFKMINDTLGHAKGDELLQAVAHRLKKTLRREDVIARLGGDEFSIVLENLKHSGQVEAIAEKAINCFYEPFLINQRDCFLTASMGVSLYPADGKTPEALIKNADIAMYKAKERGKNQCVFSTAIMRSAITETMELSNRLYRALERGELEVYYQPQVSCISRKITGMEALVRWQHPELGLVSPAKFIPIAEQTGLIFPIGEWVLQTACRQNKLWQEQGWPPMRIGVNLSLRQFQKDNLVEKVQRVLLETGLAPEYLELEITESIAMKEKRHIIKILSGLRAMGIHIAIDDFGTEYSSLNYLKHLPVDRLKIDMSFVQGIEEDPKDAAITRTIISLAKNIGLEVIAEGVENEPQFVFLQQHGCNEVQGYYFSPPLPLAAVTELLVGKYSD